MAGNRDGQGTHASFKDPTGITADQRTGVLYVSDRGNHMIRKITQKGIKYKIKGEKEKEGKINRVLGEVSTFAGTGKRGYMNGHVAQFNSPWGITYDDLDHSLLVCDCDNNKLRKISVNGNPDSLFLSSLPRASRTTSSTTRCAVR
jgi:DNA-binding beta-propeller fold protein YncE